MASLTNSDVPSMVSRLGATQISEKKAYHKWSDRNEEWEGERWSKKAKNETDRRRARARSGKVPRRAACAQGDRRRRRRTTREGVVYGESFRLAVVVLVVSCWGMSCWGVSYRAMSCWG